MNLHAGESQQSPPRLGAQALLILFFVSLAIRIGGVAAIGFSTIQFGDARAYLFAATTLAESGHYPAATETFLFRPPGYPVFLLLAAFGHPQKIALAKLGNALLGALSVPLLVALSARIFRSRRIAFLTGALAAVHPSFVLISSDIQSEPLFLLLLLACGFLLLAAVDRPSTSLALAAGACLALAALTRPTALALSCLLCAPLFDRRYPLRARAHLTAAAFLGFFLTLAPWTLRNALVFHEWIPVSDAGGYAFYQGNSDWAFGFYDVHNKRQYEDWVAAFDKDLHRRAASLPPEVLRSPTRRSGYLIEEALAQRRADPGKWAWLFARKAWDWLRPYPSSWFWPRFLVAAVGLYTTSLYVLAGIGLQGAPRRGVAWFCVGLLVLSMAIHVAIIVVWRYRVPYWDPVLLLFGVFGFDTLLSRWKPQRP